MNYQANARAELAAIDSELASLAARRRKLVQFLELEAELFPNTAFAPTPIPEPPPGTSHVSQELFRPKTAKAAITEGVIDILSSVAPFRHTRDLLNDLEARGVAIGGKDKITSISVILGRDDRFVPSRKHGWSLKKASPDSVSAESGLFIHTGDEPDHTP